MTPGGIRYDGRPVIRHYWHAGSRIFANELKTFLLLTSGEGK